MASKSKSISTSRIIFPLIFIVFSILMEITNYLYLGFKSTSGAVMLLPTYFVLDLAIILMIAGVIFLCYNKIAQNIVFYLFVTIHVVLNVINTTMYNIFGDILSYDLLYLGGEATAALSAELIDWWGAVINILFLVVMIVVGGVVNKHCKKTITINYCRRGALVLAIFLLSQSLGASMLVIQTQNLPTASAEERIIESSDKYLWDNFQFKLDAYKKFGHFGFYAKSIIDVIEHNLKGYESDDISSQIDKGYVAEDLNAPLYGDNLMVVLCESLDWYSIDPILTPTLYSLAYGKDENSIGFTNFYARNRTNISEGITLLGSMPRNVLLYKAKESGYNFDYSLPKLFKSTATNLTTKTQYVHENYASFYKRDITHGADGIGFDDLYTWEDYTGDYDFSWDSLVEDYEFSLNQIDNIFPTDCDRFLTYYTSMASHGSWVSEQPNLKKYYPLIDGNWEQLASWMSENCGEGTANAIKTDSEICEIFKRYKAGIMDFDRTVELWIEELKARGLHDNTTIVFFADHNAYYSNLCYRMKGVSKTDFSNTYVNNIPMFIYSPHLASEEGEGINEVYCNTYDILPTICDLFGLPSNNVLFQGYSIFSDDIENSLFSSNLNGMFTKDIFSLNIRDVYTPNREVSFEEIEKFKINANRFFQKQEILEKIYANGINGNIKII